MSTLISKGAQIIYVSSLSKQLNTIDFPNNDSGVNLEPQNPPSFELSFSDTFPSINIILSLSGIAAPNLPDKSP